MKCKGKTHFPTPDSRVSQVLQTLGGLAHPIRGVSSKFDGGRGGLSQNMGGASGELKMLSKRYLWGSSFDKKVAGYKPVSLQIY